MQRRQASWGQDSGDQSQLRPGRLQPAFPTLGLPEGKQPRRRQISQELLTEAACVRVEGPGADFASLSDRERHRARAQAAFRASPGRKQSP